MLRSQQEGPLRGTGKRKSNGSIDTSVSFLSAATLPGWAVTNLEPLDAVDGTIFFFMFLILNLYAGEEKVSPLFIRSDEFTKEEKVGSQANGLSKVEPWWNIDSGGRKANLEKWQNGVNWCEKANSHDSEKIRSDISIWVDFPIWNDRYFSQRNEISYFVCCRGSLKWVAWLKRWNKMTITQNAVDAPDRILLKLKKVIEPIIGFASTFRV